MTLRETPSHMPQTHVDEGVCVCKFCDIFDPIQDGRQLVTLPRHHRLKQERSTVRSESSGHQLQSTRTNLTGPSWMAIYGEEKKVRQCASGVRVGFET